MLREVATHSDNRIIHATGRRRRINARERREQPSEKRAPRRRFPSVPPPSSTALSLFLPLSPLRRLIVWPARSSYSLMMDSFICIRYCIYAEIGYNVYLKPNFLGYGSERGIPLEIPTVNQISVDSLHLERSNDRTKESILTVLFSSSAESSRLQAVCVLITLYFLVYSLVNCLLIYNIANMVCLST